MNATPHNEPIPSTEPPQDAETSRGNALSRRRLVKGAAWATPAIIVSAPAPAAAASMKDVIVSTAPCSRQGRRRTNIPFRVTTVHGATLPAGTVFTVDYAGGADRPTWSGQLANYSDVVFDPVNDSSPFGGRWGEIRFTLNEPMPANTTWDLTITMNIGNFVTGQRTSLTLTSSVPEENRITTNDSAFHEMYRDRCRS